jgi:opacity protein-like surface antigen
MRSLFGAVLLAALACVCTAQEPSGPPPPSGNKQPSLLVHELLPDIGRIGAQVAAFGGGSWNPYQAGRGIEAGGYIDLPLRRAPGGKISYEIFLGLSLSRSSPFTATNPVAYIANLASGASRSAALAGPPLAPFPVTRSVRTRLRLLHVSPFALKYTLTRSMRVRPYLNLGVDVLAAFTTVEPERDESRDFGGTSPFDDPLIAGLLAQAPELSARGTPSGQGNVELGGHGAAGVELRLSAGLSLNLEYRFTGFGGTNARLHTVSSALGFHW